MMNGKENFLLPVIICEIIFEKKKNEKKQNFCYQKGKDISKSVPGIKFFCAPNVGFTVEIHQDFVFCFIKSSTFD